MPPISNTDALYFAAISLSILSKLTPIADSEKVIF